MSEILKKKEYYIPELTPGEIDILVMINNSNKVLFKHFCKTYESHIPMMIESLQKKLYLKNINDNNEFLLEDLILRDRATELFKEVEEISFEEFWKQYHIITGISKTDKVPAEKHWKKLKKSEKLSAMSNIQVYFDNLNNKKYCKKARTYLSDKDFDNDYSNNEESDWTIEKA